MSQATVLGARMCQGTFFLVLLVRKLLLFQNEKEKKDEDYIKRWLCQRICEPDVHHRHCKRHQRRPGESGMSGWGWRWGRRSPYRDRPWLSVKYPDCKGWERSGSSAPYRQPCNGTGCKTPLPGDKTCDWTVHRRRFLLWCRSGYPSDCRGSAEDRGRDEENHQRSTSTGALYSAEKWSDRVHEGERGAVQGRINRGSAGGCRDQLLPSGWFYWLMCRTSHDEHQGCW